ncbi:MAG: type I 3-dehydroquinate dehydratase, partial [Phycisphaerales bacterium JB040]
DEGGDYDGDDADRVALLEKLTCACDTPPAYLDFELAAYQRSANLRQKINLCVAHPKQQRDGVTTRLILSLHDFEGRPADLERRLLAAYGEPACAVVKFAFRARSLRDNLDIFEITSGSPKPTIGLGMGEFGLMSRVLAPKFGGFLTFASLNDEGATAPGQPTLDELLNLYRFRSINPKTLVYGIIGWPVTQSMSPLIHNAGFAEIGHDGVYLPMPIAADPNDLEGSDASFKATFNSFCKTWLDFAGASVTLPHKERLARESDDVLNDPTGTVQRSGAANTYYCEHFWYAESEYPGWIPEVEQFLNTDTLAIQSLLSVTIDLTSPRIQAAIIGAGGVARAALAAVPGATIFNRSRDRAEALAADFPHATVGVPDQLAAQPFDLYINCTPLGMAGGPDPAALAIPLDDLPPLPPETVIFDTVYNPIETPLLKAARARGLTVIDGVQMFVKQAAHQFQLWTGRPAPEDLFDRLVRERLSES